MTPCRTEEQGRGAGGDNLRHGSMAGTLAARGVYALALRHPVVGTGEDTSNGAQG